MRCIDESLFMKLLLGELSPKGTPEVEAHLDTCASCRQLVAEGLRAQNPEEPGTDRTQTVLPTRVERKEELPLEKGTAVGRYLVLEVLGTGGMGVVYRAYDPELDRRVALKLLRVGALGLEADEGRAHLVREAKAMARVSHPHVVSVYDVGTFGQQVFLTMELVEAQTLRQWLKAGSRPWRQVLALFLDAGRGLAAAHAAGVVHGDFKPENLLVGRDGRLRVTDFGLARLGTPAAGPPALPAAAALVPLEGMDRSAVGGTPAYMPPEQLLGNARAGTAGDQFAFCVTLHEALYGERPFEGTSLTALTAELRAGRVRPPPSGTRVPPWLRRVVLRGLATRPEERYASLEALLAALQKDPAVRWRRGLQVAGGAALLFSAVGLTHAVSTRGAGACEGAPEEVSAIWGPAQQGAAESAFLATGQPFAASSWQRVRRELDAYTAAWATTRTTACEATRVRDQQSEEVLAWRMRCLDSRLADVAALTRVLSQADAGVVAESHRAVKGLPPLSGCSEELAPGGPPAPEDEAAKARRESLQLALSEGRALLATGRYKEGVARVEPAAKAAREAGNRREAAEASLVLGELREGAGDWKGAEAALFDAVDAAEATRQDTLAARAWTLLVRVYSTGLDEYELATRWVHRAQASIDRLGAGHDMQQVRLWTNAGTLLRQQDLADEALARHEQALELVKRVSGPDSLETAEVHRELGLTRLAQMRVDEARKHLERAVALTQQALGPEHPEVARVRLTLVQAFHQEPSMLAEAESMARHSLEVFERTLGLGHPRVYDALNDLGKTLQWMNRNAEAVPLFERALAIAEKTDGPESFGVAVLTGNIGVTLFTMGKHAEAIPYLQRAVALGEKLPGRREAARVILMKILARALVKEKRVEEALTTIQKAADLQRSLKVDVWAQSTIILIELGATYLEAKRPAEAIAPLEQVIAGWETAVKKRPGHLAYAHFLLARALWDSGSDRPRALRLAAEAKALAEKDGAVADDTRKRATAWLAERGVR